MENGVAYSRPTQGTGLWNIDTGMAIVYSPLKEFPFDYDVIDHGRVDIKVSITRPQIPQVFITVDKLSEIDPQAVWNGTLRPYCDTVNIVVDHKSRHDSWNAFPANHLKIEVGVPTAQEDILILSGRKSVHFDTVIIECELASAPPSTGTGGGGFSGYYIYAMQQQYSEITLNFENRVIDEIIGLPQGMMFDGIRIKGTPANSGEYTMVYKFDDGKSSICTLKVSPFVRTK